MTDNIENIGLDEAKRGARLIRNDLLTATDRHVLPDSPLSVAELKSVKTYRKWLRDYPAGMTDDDFMTFKGLPTYDEWKAGQEITQEEKAA